MFSIRTRASSKNSVILTPPFDEKIYCKTTFFPLFLTHGSTGMCFCTSFLGCLFVSKIQTFFDHLFPIRTRGSGKPSVTLTSRFDEKMYRNSTFFTTFLSHGSTGMCFCTSFLGCELKSTFCERYTGTLTFYMLIFHAFLSTLYSFFPIEFRIRMPGARFSISYVKCSII